MSESRHCIILNPHAGSASTIGSLRDSLGSCTFFETQQPGDATRLARRALEEGYTRVIAAGGDGTLNEVVNGLAVNFDRVELGLIPLGTANDFARSAGIPTELDRAARLIRTGVARRLDVIKLTTGNDGNLHYFINVSAGGFSTVLNEKLDKSSKERWGTLAYAWSAVKALPELEPYRVRVAFDSEEPSTFSAYNIVVANARYAGGNIPVAPRARLDDGLFDVLIFRAVPLARLTTLVPKAVFGQHGEDDDVLYRQARQFKISSEPPLEVNADGEVIGPCPATYEVMPRALRVIVGPDIDKDFE